MDQENGLEQMEAAFLAEVYRMADGKTSAKVETGQVGQALGLDRLQAGKLAEELIGKGMLEVRTLSGGVALTDEGAAAAGGSGGQTPARLGDEPVAGERDIALVETALGKVQAAAGADWNALAAVVAGVRTVQAQLASPRPRTAVLRAALAALAEDLAAAGMAEAAADLTTLLGD